MSLIVVVGGWRRRNTDDACKCFRSLLSQNHTIGKAGRDHVHCSGCDNYSASEQCTFFSKWFELQGWVWTDWPTSASFAISKFPCLPLSLSACSLLLVISRLYCLCGWFLQTQLNCLRLTSGSAEVWVASSWLPQCPPWFGILITACPGMAHHQWVLSFLQTPLCCHSTVKCSWLSEHSGRLFQDSLSCCACCEFWSFQQDCIELEEFLRVPIPLQEGCELSRAGELTFTPSQRSRLECPLVLHCW